MSLQTRTFKVAVKTATGSAVIMYVAQSKNRAMELATQDGYIVLSVTALICDIYDYMF
jgi:hypothetical protein